MFNFAKKQNSISKATEQEFGFDDEYINRSEFTDDVRSTGRSSDSGEVLAGSETRMVAKSKTLVLLVLLLATTFSAVVTYTFTRNADRALFEAAVDEYASEAHEISQIMAMQVVVSLEALTISITSYARSINATWPYVVVNDFQERCEGLLNLTGSYGLAFLPIVPREDSDKWTEFTLKTNAGLPSDVAIRAELWQPLYPDLEYAAPLWQRVPPHPKIVNRDFYRPERDALMTKERSVIVVDFSEGDTLAINDTSVWPQIYLSAPIFETFKSDSKLVAYITFRVFVHRLYRNILPEGANGMHVVIDATSCPFMDNEVTFVLNGPNAVYKGIGDLHDPSYDHMRSNFKFNFASNICDFYVSIYPSRELADNYKTNKPIYHTIGVVLIFMMTSAVFFLYDFLVERRQTKVMSSAKKTGAIVSSLFPAQFRDRLLEGSGGGSADGMKRPKLDRADSFYREKADQYSSKLEGHNLLYSKPLADLFPFTTVMFGDIAGFTAWSSVREPAQVFTLLEQIYSSFDAIAQRRGIFKVETIGDCYVAAAGLPRPRQDHAAVMARFAYRCRQKFNHVVSKLEFLLGPDTAELRMRFGLHSGPVTAGVLRGEKCRFQLFGDTINTASRIESTGERNMIHVSEDTANLLMAAGRSDWIQPREGLVSLKGKGAMQTYWLMAMKFKSKKYSDTIADPCSEHTDDSFFVESGLESGKTYDTQNERIERLVDWNVEVLQKQLKKIVAKRDSAVLQEAGASKLRFTRKEGETILDEVLEVIPLSNKENYYQRNPEMITMDKQVVIQLRDYVKNIARMYRDNFFHNFEHASHVTMSVSKLLARIDTKDIVIDMDFQKKEQSMEESELHEYTYGITSDPLIHFACALSALIHDVDHTGVPNSQLVKENAKIAEIYRNKSVAEQNSVDLAWELLMDETYEELRSCIFATQDELNRFRNLVVNCVMATDIVDKELGALRKNRWNKAFHNTGEMNESEVLSSPKEDVNRKATIVIEHIIQASDVSHTMQHWHVYLKWNERFFHECYQAYLDGRADKDPSKSWYEGELGFFDYYIIPLAKKLKECRVFGVASDEYLNYALANRQEWESKGRSVLEKYLLNHKE